MDQSEARLIDRILEQDDRHAFRQLVLLHQSALRSFLRRVFSDAALADDCAQESWLIAYQKLATYRGGSFRSWLLTIGMRKAMRMRAREGRMEAIEAETPAPDAPEGLKLDLDKALARLSLPERSCLHLAACEDMSHEEIAGALELPLGTVKSHLSRGKEKLKRLLGEPVSRKETHDARG